MNLVDITNFFVEEKVNDSPMKKILKNFENKDNLYKELKALIPVSNKLEMYSNDPRYLYVKIHLKVGIVVERTFREDGLLLGTGLDVIFQFLGHPGKNHSDPDSEPQ
jgi:hypothetical protein